MKTGCPPLLHPRVKPHILAPIFEMPGSQSPPAAPFFLGKNRRNGREHSVQIAMTDVWRLIFRNRPAPGVGAVRGRPDPALRMPRRDWAAAATDRRTHASNGGGTVEADRGAPPRGGI
jgi:hypothetical protein